MTAWQGAPCRYFLGVIAYRQGDLLSARVHLEHAAWLHDENEDSLNAASARGLLSRVLVDVGSIDEVRRCLIEVLNAARLTNRRLLMLRGLDTSCWLVAHLNRCREAAQLCGAVEMLRTASDSHTLQLVFAKDTDLPQHLRAALGEDDFAAALAEGRALSVDDALTLALALTSASAADTHAPD